MKALIINRTSQVPSVTLDKSSGIFEFSGPSLPEDAIEFYAPINQWVDDYAEDPNEKSEFIFKIDYYNTASSKMIFELIKKIDKLYMGNNDVKIIWYYAEDDEHIMEAGEDFSSIVRVPFELIAVEVKKKGQQD